MDKWRRAFIVCLFLVAAFVPLFSFPADDGLRHVGAAFGDVKSWGDVYPFSVFEQFGDYDPWLGYDLALRIAARQIKTIPISATTLKYSLVKVLMLIFISAFLYLVVKRSGILEHVKDQASFTLAMIILLFFLFLPLRRVLTIRPFVFGTLYLLYSIGETGIVRGGISATILTFFYPYLSWFYIIPVAFSHFLKGDKRFAVGSIAFIVLYLVMQPFPFWGFQAALLNSEVTRRSIYTTSISEFAFSLSNSSFYMYLFAILTSYPFFSDKARRLNFLNLTLLIYLVPAIKYVRYFIDVILPLLFVLYGTEYLSLLLERYNKLMQSWGNILKANTMKIKPMLKLGPGRLFAERRVHNRGARTNLKPYIVLTYLALLSLCIVTMRDEILSLRNFEEMLLSVPERKVVFTDFNSQYRILFLRPDLRVVPSCELGFPSKDISNEYLEFFNEGRFAPVLKKTRAEFFLESRSMYLHPQEAGLLELVTESGKLMLWKISGDGG